MIPKSYNLLGHKINVHIVPESRWKPKSCVGTFEPHRHRIMIRGSLDESLRGHTFYHEMVHSILSSMGHDLNEDENFVDMFAGLLHQAATTMEFPPVRKKKS